MPLYTLLTSDQQLATYFMSSPIIGSRISQVKAHNRTAILLSLLRQGAVSRVQLAEQTSLSNAAITNLTADLLAEGLIVEQTQKSDAERHVGRPRRMLALVEDARYTVGVHIGIGYFAVGISNLSGHLVARVEQPFDVTDPATTVVPQIAQAVEALMAQSNIREERFVGMGVGASGLVNYHTGVNAFAPRLGWRDAPLQTMLESKLNLPVVVDNNVRLMALGEKMFGQGQSLDSFAFIFGQVGLAAGFVLNGELYRGQYAGAGEIGHTVMIPSGGELCDCGNTGCLETLVSESVLLRQARKVLDIPAGVG